MNAILIVVFLAFESAVYCSTIKDVISRKSTVLNDSIGLGMYDGKNTTIKDHPSLGALTWKGPFLCQVTIVSSQWVVATGHCVNGFIPDDIDIMVASDDLKAGIKFNVDKIVIHPKFDKVNYDYDYNFACIKIKGTFKWSDKVKAVTLPKEAAKPGTEMVVAGWGKTDAVNDYEESNSILLQGNMKWLEKKKCEATYKPFRITLTDRMACAYNKGKTTLCNGDWADAFINRGVFYGIFQAGVSTGWCTANATPLLLANVKSVADWVSTITGAKFEDESLF